MLKIKLARFGKRNQPHYRIVVNEARSKRDGKYIEMLGHYAPAQQPKVLELNLEAYNQWIDKGAQPTETVAHLAERYESGDPFPEKEQEAAQSSSDLALPTMDNTKKEILAFAKEHQVEVAEYKTKSELLEKIEAELT